MTFQSFFQVILQGLAGQCIADFVIPSGFAAGTKNSEALMLPELSDPFIPI
jgi:hypothetical protein